MRSTEFIPVVTMSGYPLHDSYKEVRELLAGVDGSRIVDENSKIEEYFYNKEGYVVHFFTDRPIPGYTEEPRLWSKLEGLEEDYHEDFRASRDSGEHIFKLDLPAIFETDRQRYQWVGDVWGYAKDSSNPDDYRYEE